MPLWQPLAGTTLEISLSDPLPVSYCSDEFSAIPNEVKVRPATATNLSDTLPTGNTAMQNLTSWQP